MTRDQIAQLMQDSAGADWGTEAHFQRFAAIVAAAEREAVLKMLEDCLDYKTLIDVAKAIRARDET